MSPLTALRRASSPNTTAYPLTAPPPTYIPYREADGKVHYALHPASITIPGRSITEVNDLDDDSAPLIALGSSNRFYGLASASADHETDSLYSESRISFPPPGGATQRSQSQREESALELERARALSRDSSNPLPEDHVYDEDVEDPLMRFTATGRPIPIPKRQPLASMANVNPYAIPSLLPQRYTDDSIIPVVVRIAPSEGGSRAGVSPHNTAGIHQSRALSVPNVTPPAAAVPTTTTTEEAKHRRRRSSLLGLQLKRFSSSTSAFATGAGASPPKNKQEKEKEAIKVVFMPRREYLKYFAKDYDGRYIGTEPERGWTEGELEAEFGRYRKEGLTPRGASGKMGSTLGVWVRS
jgi:hypothetical protein